MEGLRPATEYSFALQAYNSQGRSSFTPPSVAVTMLGQFRRLGVRFHRRIVELRQGAGKKNTGVGTLQENEVADKLV